MNLKQFALGLRAEKKTFWTSREVLYKIYNRPFFAIEKIRKEECYSSASLWRNLLNRCKNRQFKRSAISKRTDCKEVNGSSTSYCGKMHMNGGMVIGRMGSEFEVQPKSSRQSRGNDSMAVLALGSRALLEGRELAHKADILSKEKRSARHFIKIWKAHKNY